MSCRSRAWRRVQRAVRVARVSVTLLTTTQSRGESGIVERLAVAQPHKYLPVEPCTAVLPGRQRRLRRWRSPLPSRQAQVGRSGRRLPRAATPRMAVVAPTHHQDLWQRYETSTSSMVDWCAPAHRSTTAVVVDPEHPTRRRASPAHRQREAHPRSPECVRVLKNNSDNRKADESPRALDTP